MAKHGETCCHQSAVGNSEVAMRPSHLWLVGRVWRASADPNLALRSESQAGTAEAAQLENLNKTCLQLGKTQRTH